MELDVPQATLAQLRCDKAPETQMYSQQATQVGARDPAKGLFEIQSQTLIGQLAVFQAQGIQT